MGIEIKYNGKRPEQMLADYQRLKAGIMVLVGNEAINFVKDNFKRQSFDTGAGEVKWASRQPDAPRNDRPLLIDRGILKNGIRKTITGNTVTISVAPPADEYAAIHNTGGQITQRITPQMKKWAWAMYRRTKNPKYKYMALSKKATRTIKIPQRQFIGDSAALDRRLRELIEDEMRRVLTV